MTRVSVRMSGLPIGWLSQDDVGDISYQYTEEWLDKAPHALSQSLPLQREPFGHKKSLPFFAGLLPDSKSAREELGRILQVSSGDDFGLLTAIGRDCAGAVSILPEDAPVLPDSRGVARWVKKSEAELAGLLRNLPSRPLYYDEEDNFYFSLAGVHDKIAVLLTKEGVALPTHGTPSSHILKVDISGLPDSIRTEHFCLSLARKIGLHVPQTSIHMAEDIPYMLIERYDRKRHIAADGTVSLRRVHQEDFCQARGVMPFQKYESKGGPGFSGLIETIRKSANKPAADILRLLEYAAYNLAVGNPDAHAKNFSLVYRSSRPELAPLYDVNCAYAFREHYKRQVPRLAMRIGNATLMPSVNDASLRMLAEECGINPKLVVDTFQNVFERAAKAASELREEFTATTADTPLLDRIVEFVTARIAEAKPESPRM